MRFGDRHVLAYHPTPGSAMPLQVQVSAGLCLVLLH
jgi:hypothetical protein